MSYWEQNELTGPAPVAACKNDVSSGGKVATFVNSALP